MTNKQCITKLLCFTGRKKTSTKGPKKDSSSTSSSISTAVLESYVERLKMERNRSSTRKVYYSVWKQFNEFFIKLDIKPETWEDRLILFVGYLVEGNKKSATIKSYVSAIKAVLKDDEVEINK